MEFLAMDPELVQQLQSLAALADDGRVEIGEMQVQIWSSGVSISYSLGLDGTILECHGNPKVD